MTSSPWFWALLKFCIYLVVVLSIVALAAYVESEAGKPNDDE